MIKAWFKYLNVILIVFFSLVLTKPFYISAEDDYSDYLIGYNFRIIEYDVNTMSSFSMNNITASGSLDTKGVSGNVISMGQGSLTNGQNYYSTGLAGGSMRIKGDIDLDFRGSLSSTNTRSYIRVIEVDLLFNKSYNGSFFLDIYKDTADYVFSNFVYCNSDKVTISFVDDNSSTMTNTPYYEFEMSLIDLTPNTNLDDILEQLKYRNYNFPTESFLFINSLINNNGYELNEFAKYSSYSYPVFTISKNDYLIKTTNLNMSQESNKYIVIFYIDKYIGNYAPRFMQYFDFDTNKISLSIDNISYFYDFSHTPNSPSYIIKCTFTCIDSGGGVYLNLKYINDNNAKIMPIYANYLSNKNLSTEFALTYGLNNRLLEDIDRIANGNNISNNSVNQADQTNQQANSVFTQEETIVNNAETSLNQNLQTLDVANKNNNLFGNSKFIASAQWVKDQFDFFTNNNAFSYLITFSLVIGISLVIVGKLRG